MGRLMARLTAGVLVLAFAAGIGFGLGVSVARAEVVVGEPSLEVNIGEATPYGPLLDPDDGCFIYGSFYASVVQGRGQGIPMAHYLALVRDAPARDKLPGMAPFLVGEINFIYSLPQGFTQVPYIKVRQRAIDMCRKARGRTWLFRTPV
jgi:hypothetical protein